MSDESDAISKASKMLGIERDEVAARMEKMPVNDVIDVLDAIASSDEFRVGELLGNNVDEDGGMESPEGEESPEEKDEFEVNPLFMKSAGAAKKNVDDKEIEEEDFDPTIGAEVRVNGEDGIVKIVHGPNDTTGVMIDGQTTMVKKSQVKRVKQIEESMMGMTPMVDIKRMQELAGMKSETPLGPGIVPMDTAEPAPANDEYEVTIEPETVMASPEPTVAPVSPVADIAAASAPTIGIDQIMASFAQIEAALPEIKLGDAKEIRARINDIVTKLNEGLDGRRRKV